MNFTEKITSLNRNKPGYLRINDIELDIPPENIVISHSEYDNSFFTMREAAPTTNKTGLKRTSIMLRLVFDINNQPISVGELSVDKGKYRGWNDLSRLLIQTRKSPIATVENEKIRTELMGGYADQVTDNGSFRFQEPTTIGTIIDSIQGEVDSENPSLIRVTVNMTHFNYLPYSYDLKYAEQVNQGPAPLANAGTFVRPTRLPGKNYEAFYKSGTYDAIGNCINDPSATYGSESDIATFELVYKEYDIIGSNKYPKYAKEQKSNFLDPKKGAKKNASKLHSAKFYNLNHLEYRKTPRYNDGWVLASRGSLGEREDVVVYRYVRVKIPASDIIGQAGELLLQDISFSLSTNVAYIPMEKYSMPTAQFMGGSIASLRAIIYASPEVEKIGAGGTVLPVSTSKKLGTLQRIFDQINENRIKYSKYSKDDFLLVGHPLAKLLKYEKYEKEEGVIQELKVTDKDVGNLLTLNPDNFFSCVVKDRVSQTIEGSPFASQLQVDLKEQKINHHKESIRALRGKDGKLTRVSVFDAIKDVMNVLVTKYGLKIIHNNAPKEDEPFGRVSITGSEFFTGLNNPDRKFLLELEDLMNGSLYFKPYNNLNEMMDDSSVFNSTTQDFIKSVLIKKGIGKNTKFEQVRFKDPKTGKMKNDVFKVTGNIDDEVFDENAYTHVRSGVSRGDAAGQANQRQAQQRRTIIGEVNKKGFCSYGNIGKLLSKILKEANLASFSWGKPYLEKAEALKNTSEVPSSNTYKDLLLTEDLVSPTFYFHEDSFLRQKQADFMYPMIKHHSLDVENTIMKYAQTRDGVEDWNNALRKNAFGQSGILSGDKRSTDEEALWTPDGRVGVARNFEEEDIGEMEVPAIGLHGNASPGDRNYLAVQAAMGLEGVEKGISKSLPAFKILLMEDSEIFSEGIRRDDLDSANEENALTYYNDISTYFELSSIIDIRIAKKEDNPVDLLVIRIASNSRDKVNIPASEMTHEELMDRIRKPRTFNDITKVEQRFQEKGLREGTRIQVRLGHTPDPNDMSVEFNGRIASVEGKDIIEIVAAGNGAELVQDIKNATQQDVYSFNSNTGNLIREVLRKSPELVSFGTLGANIKGFELTFLPGFVSGRSITDNIFAPDLFTSLLRGDGIGDGTEEWAYTTAENMLDSLAYAHAGAVALRGLGRLAGKRTFDKTVDQAFGKGVRGAIGLAGKGLPKVAPKSGITGMFSKIMTPVLRTVTGKAAGKVAGKVALRGVPLIGQALLIYDVVSGVYSSVKTALVGSRYSIFNMTIWDIMQEMTLRHPGAICSVVPYDKRSTIFFGEPHQFYNHRPPTVQEAGMIPETRFLELGFDTTTQVEDAMNYLDINPSTRGNVASDGELISKQRKTKQEMLTSSQLNRPLTGEESIIAMREPFRKYHFVTSEKDIIKNNIRVTSRGVHNSVQVAYPEDSDDGNVDGTVGYSGYKITEKIQADDDIFPEFIKNKVYTFHNAHTEEVKDLPQRYAKALLCRNLEKSYDGKLIILGRPKIKPHDVVMIYDTYNDIIGPVGVRECTQILDGRRGWITEVTPKLMVFPDNSAGMMQLNMIKKLTHYLGISDQELFYTNIKRFMPNDFGYDHALSLRDAAASLEQVQQNTTGKNLLTDDHTQEVKEHAAEAGLVLKSGAHVVATTAAYSSVIGVSDATEGAKALRTSATSGATAIRKKATSLGRGIAGLPTSPTTTKAGKIFRFSAGRSLKTAARIGAPFAGILSVLVLDSVIEGIVSYTKYRQPIMFHPLTRNSQPWYGGMRGFKDNTLLESIGESITRWDNVREFNFALFERYLERVGS